MCWLNVIILVFGVISITSADFNTRKRTAGADRDREECPGLYERVFKDSLPRANLSAGVYSVYNDGSAVSLRDCVLACCMKLQEGEECNVALLTGAASCYHVACMSNDLCLPQPQRHADDATRTRMVLVSPVGDSDWADILLQSKQQGFAEKQRFRDAFDGLWQMSQNDGDDPFSTTEQQQSIVVTSNSTQALPQPQPTSLHVIVDSKQVQLPENNVTLVANIDGVGQQAPQDQQYLYQYEWNTLQQPEPDSLSGAIRSQQDNRLELSHLSQGFYMFNVTVTNSGKLAELAAGWTLANVTVLSAARVNAPPNIIITPANQTVRLPNTAAILDASATSDDVDSGDRVQYHWELQQGPLGYQPSLPSTATLQLTDLTRPGQYTFQVSAVDSEGAQATAPAYVTVLPPIDYPPTADAGPDQVLYLPLNDGELVLSGNGSTDDHDIVSWEWTRINSVDLTSNNTNSNSNSNMQAVDMRDTRTPTLRLGRIIEPGVYTFQLRVGDASNQTSTAQVRLFIKEREIGVDNKDARPLAIISGDASVILPAGQTWTILDGSNSTFGAVEDSNNSLYYNWSLLLPPPSNTNITVHINSPKSALTNITGLTTPGPYQFRLQVTRNINSTMCSTADVNVTVQQALERSNAPPQAVATIAENAIYLPRNAIYLNASQSSDDDKIVSYVWTPCADSPATFGVGSVAEGTDLHPVLVLLLAGVSTANPIEVCWNVTVTDVQGLTDCEVVKFGLVPDALLEYLVQVVVGTSKSLMVVAQYESMMDALQSIELFIEDTAVHIHVRPRVGNTATPTHSSLTLYATTIDNNNTTTYISADRLANLIHDTLPGLLLPQQLALISVRPVSCHSITCSGHGQCDLETRTCHCQTLWIPNMLSYVHNEWNWERDCSWSVLYVTLAALAALSAVLCVAYVAWIVLCCQYSRMTKDGAVSAANKPTQQKQRFHHSNSRRRGRNNHSYTLIDNTVLTSDANDACGIIRRNNRNKLHSDSDSLVEQGDSADSDRDDNVVFNSLNNKLLHNTRSNNKLLLNT